MSKRADQRERLAQEQLRADVAEVLAIPAGRRYLWELLNRCYLFSSTWTGNAEIHRNEGMRIVGLSIKDDIEAVDPRRFLDVLAAKMQDDVVPEDTEDDKDV